MEGWIVVFTFADGERVAWGPFLHREDAALWEDRYADAPDGARAEFVLCHVPGMTPTCIAEWRRTD